MTTADTLTTDELNIAEFVLTAFSYVGYTSPGQACELPSQYVPVSITNCKRSTQLVFRQILVTSGAIYMGMYVKAYCRHSGVAPYEEWISAKGVLVRWLLGIHVNGYFNRQLYIPVWEWSKGRLQRLPSAFSNCDVDLSSVLLSRFRTQFIEPCRVQFPSGDYKNYANAWRFCQQFVSVVPRDGENLSQHVATVLNDMHALVVANCKQGSGRLLTFGEYDGA